MKILFVSSWYPPVLTGSSLWTESLVLSLRQRGHDVRVISTHWQGNLRESKKSEAERVYNLPAYLLPPNKFLLGIPDIPIAYSLTNRRKVLNIVREFKPDIIHQMNHIFDTLFLSAYAAKKTGTPLVGSITTPVQSTRLLNYLLMHIVDVLFVYPFGVRYWKHVICADTEIARYVSDTYRQSIKNKIIRNIHVGVHKRIWKNESVKKTPWPNITMVGHIYNYRDPTNIILAMPAILKHFPNAKFNIAGKIRFRRPVNEVKRLGLESSVKFLGEVSTDQVSKLVSSAHIFAILHQLVYTSISLTSFEAMNFGTPVVTNAPENLYENSMIKDGENIVLINRDNVDEIAEKIIFLLENKHVRERIGHNGKRFIRSFLTWENCAERTEKLYENILLNDN